MIVFPAIDLKDSKVVRLRQGKYDAVTEYSDDPVTVAKQWEAQGAQWLHVVDLDGALEGKPKNAEIVKAIAKAVKIPVQTGGGIRNIVTIEDYLSSQIGRVVLGTRIVEDPEFRKNISRFGDKLAVSLDCSKGMVAQRGWTTVSDKKAVDFAKELFVLGVKCIIYTDIARDGMLTGPDYAGIEELLQAVKIPLIASGGIASIEDIKKLKKLTPQGLIGAITGKAIYEGQLDFKEAVKYAQ